MQLIDEKLFYQQIRILHALLMREIKIRYGRQNIGFVWMFVEPMLFTVIIITMWSNSVFPPISISITAFTLIGYSSVLVWRNPVAFCTNAAQSNKNIFLLRQIKMIHLFITRCLLEISSASLSFIILALLFIALGLMTFPDNFLIVLAGWLLLIWFSVGLALLIAGIGLRYQFINRLWAALVYLIFPFSGSAFMVDWMPSDVQNILLWLPMVHCIELIRYGFFGTTIKVFFSIPYIIFSCTLLSFFSLLILKNVSQELGVDE